METFLVEAEAPHAFDALLDELTDTVIPNLNGFRGLALVSSAPARSVEVANGIARLTAQLGSIATDANCVST